MMLKQVLKLNYQIFKILKLIRKSFKMQQIKKLKINDLIVQSFLIIIISLKISDISSNVPNDCG
jgi:hypothetical protein